MGDSAASIVTSEVTREEGGSIKTVTKRTVTSVATSHVESSQQSVVRMETVVGHQAAVQTQQEISQTHSSTAEVSTAETKAVEDTPLPPVIEPQPVDENANSIPDEPEAAQIQQIVSEPEPAAEPIPEPAAEPPPEPVVEPAQESTKEVDPEPAPEPEAAAVQEPAPELEAAPVPEPAPEPEAAPVPEPVVEPVPEPSQEPEAQPTVEVPAAEEISQESIKTQLHEIISEIEQEVLPEEEDEVKEEIVAPVEETKPVEVEEKETKPVEDSQLVVESQPVAEPQPVAVPEPVAELVAEPQLIDGQVVPGYEGEMEEYEYLDEDGNLRHTWRPRGKYDVKKTEILYEDVVPIQVPDVTLSQVPVKPQPPPQPVQHEEISQSMVANHVSSSIQGLTNGGYGPEGDFPLEIPEGIPLLARILPKTDQGLEGDKKISLERLFTPATDSGDLTPLKKKAFSSSAFYRPDHPTIDDQVELAQRISFSLVDDNNKMSRGQSMYIKRKNRSMRWIHQGGEGEEDYEGPGGMEMMMEDMQRLPEKPPMKLLMSSKGVQDCHQVQEHYENLMNQPAPPSPEVNKLVSEMANPTGKGAELFAKRKKRMDKFIVDETTVQKSQQTSSSSITQQSSFSSSSASSVSSSQNIITGISSGPPVAAPGAGAMYTAEVKVVQRAPTQSTPVDLPHHSLLDLVSEEKSDKRLSASFNMAAKGFGTYNKHYTAVTFATKS